MEVLALLQAGQKPPAGSPPLSRPVLRLGTAGLTASEGSLMEGYPTRRVCSAGQPASLTRIGAFAEPNVGVFIASWFGLGR